MINTGIWESVSCVGTRIEDRDDLFNLPRYNLQQNALCQMDVGRMEQYH